MDDYYNNYITRSTMPHTTTQHKTHQQRLTSTTTSNAIATCSNNNTIFSSDEKEFVIKQNIIEEVENMSSEGCGDFEGFDDYTTPNSSGLMNDTSREDFNMYSYHFKRHSSTNLNEFQQDTESAVETIEVDDDDEDIVISKDGKNIYRPKEQVAPLNLQDNRCETYAPDKRRKHDDRKCCKANTPIRLQTPPDQIVEVNSDSTTNSLKQKRMQINNKFQMNFCQQQNYKVGNNLNKCSTESTSEFPVSSPSNPQPRCGKYPSRPPLLKNTLPADSFERQLAMITACNPQMTLAEKIQSWECGDELSDLEDVYQFDEEFKRIEKQKKREMQQRDKMGSNKNTEVKSYDFFTFCQKILNNIKEQKIQKYNTSGQGGGCSAGVSGLNKCIDTSGSESSNSVVHIDERPSTSAVAQLQLQQRRSKPNLCLETGEPKKRAIKDIPQRNQNSTTPPQTSSSDNERECFQNTKNNAVQRHILTHSTVKCPSSSEEAISQDVPTHVLLRTSNRYAQVALRSARKKYPVCSQPSVVPAKLNENKSLAKNSRILTDEEIDSVFRLHRLNKERDKYRGTQINEAEGQATSIIQMRLDFTNKSKTEIMEKKEELFKTPIIPQKYLTNPLMSAEYQMQNKFLPTKTKLVETDGELRRPSNVSSLSKLDDVSNKVGPEKVEKPSTMDDLDGVYHQQHEFCNYLGLTGMSTATAMANAVAELAQCNLARRSMRVLRQQQQERRDKSAKGQRVLEALKLKQKEIRKREKVGCDILPVILTEQATIPKSDGGSPSQSSEHTNYSKKTSSPKSLNSFEIVKKDPEIKILCHIAAKSTDAGAMSSECIKKTLLQQEKQCKPVKPANISREIHDTNKHFGGKSFQVNESIITNEKNDLMGKENKMSRSPVLSTDIYSLKNTRSSSRILYEPKEAVYSENTPVVSELDFVDDSESITKSTHSKFDSSFFKPENLSKSEIPNEHSNIEEINLFHSSMHLLTATPDVIKQKFQMALEKSRKSKPSIFIVQSIESKKEKANDLNMQKLLFPKNVNAITTSPTTAKSSQNIKSDLKEPQACTTKVNKSNEKQFVKTRNGKKHPIPKRRLRKRKIIVIKRLKKTQKSYERLNAIKRGLRSSPRINEIQKRNSLGETNDKHKEKIIHNKVPASNETKSYRTVHTETKDLEIYLSNQTKTRVMAKASALLERSKRTTLRGSYNLVNKSTLTPKIQKSKFNLRTTKTRILKTRSVNATSKKNKVKTKSSEPRKNLSTDNISLTKQMIKNTNTSSTSNFLEAENVVVSSTTNTYDERPNHELLATQSPITLRSADNTASYAIASSQIKTKDQLIQCSVGTDVHYINTTPLPTQVMRNPLRSQHGSVLYIYHEVDVLIVIQERIVSFWKCSKLMNMFITPNKVSTSTAHQSLQQGETTLLKQNVLESCCNNQLGQPASSSTLIETRKCGEWVQLGELRRLNFDFEITAPYANRICLHNSTPIYLEMRAQKLPKNQRDCNLLSMYINIYYYHDEDMIAKCNSIPLDSIQSDFKSVNYTTLTDSRYFIITWPQENLLGKTRSGLCKYSLTPQLDTLASIREFKSMRHIIRYLECLNDDKLIGFGDTEISIWDYRSGDILMNFDLEIPMGKNLGSIYFPSQDIEQSSMLILHHFRNICQNTPPELMTIACTVSHTQPSYRVLQETNLPMPAFKTIKCAINTGDHLVVIGDNDDELWISTTNPRLIAVIHNTQNSKRFYSRQRSQLIELTEKTLNINTLTNHILQLAAGSLLK